MSGVTVEFFGGPRDGEVRDVPAPLPGRIEHIEPGLTPLPGPEEDILRLPVPEKIIVGVYARDSELRFRGTMVRYNWEGWEAR